MPTEPKPAAPPIDLTLAAQIYAARVAGSRNYHPDALAEDARLAFRAAEVFAAVLADRAAR